MLLSRRYQKSWPQIIARCGGDKVQDAEQGRRWQGLDLGAACRRDVDRFVDLVAADLDLVEQILAKPSLEFGLEALARHRR